jgi:peroxiredoxin
MRRTSVLILSAFLAVSLVACQRSDTDTVDVRVGTNAPDFTLSDMNGDPVTLSSLRGKVVLVNFWATWCPPCRAEKPTMERLHHAFSGQDFVILAVNTENDVAAVRDYLSKNPLSFPVLLDNEARVQSLYGVFRFPETFLIGKDGTVLERYIGARDWSSVEFLRYVSTLLKE